MTTPQDFTRNAPPVTPGQLDAILNSLDSNVPHDDWKAILFAYYHEGGNYETALAWSMRGANYQDGCLPRSTWDGFANYPGDVRRIGSLFHYARLQGVVPPPEHDAENRPVWTAFRPVSADELLHLPTVEWLADRLIPARGTTLLHGGPKDGKSTLVDMLASSDEWEGKPTVRTWWVHLTEERPMAISARLARMGITPSSDFFAERLGFLIEPDSGRKDPDILASELYHFYHYCNPPPGVIVIDTLLHWGNSMDVNNASDVVRVMRPFLQLSTLLPELSLVIIHQTRKGGGRAGGNVEAVLGSQQLAASFDSVIGINRNRTTGIASLYVEGRYLDDNYETSFRQTHTPDGIAILPGDGVAAQLLETVATLSDPLTVKELVQLLAETYGHEYTEKHVSRTLGKTVNFQHDGGKPRRWTRHF